LKYKLQKDYSRFGLVLSKCIQKASLYSWWGYSKVLEYYWGMGRRRVDRDSEFLRNGFKLGTLNFDELTSLMDLLESAPDQKMNAQDCHPEYLNNPYLEAIQSKFDDHFCYYDISGHRDLLRKIFSNYSSTVRDCLGHPARIVNIRCWKTLSGATEEGPNAWHVDHLAYGVHKMLVYLSPPGEETGTTEIRLKDGSVKSVKGPGGTWIFFNPTDSIHRGVPPRIESNERIILELMTVPAFKENFEPVFAGLNATYPWFPWTEI
tara:strand:- start:3049 stop:3837 length:789 start_codon:yes stop_codon:yes gene_type:complete